MAVAAAEPSPFESCFAWRNRTPATRSHAATGFCQQGWPHRDQIPAL